MKRHFSFPRLSFAETIPRPRRDISPLGAAGTTHTIPLPRPSIRPRMTHELPAALPAPVTTLRLGRVSHSGRIFSPMSALSPIADDRRRRFSTIRLYFDIASRGSSIIWAATRPTASHCFRLSRVILSATHSFYYSSSRWHACSSFSFKALLSDDDFSPADIYLLPKIFYGASMGQRWPTLSRLYGRRSSSTEYHRRVSRLAEEPAFSLALPLMKLPPSLILAA